VKYLILAAMLPVLAYADKHPTGPELAGKEIGILLQAIPAFYQTNTFAGAVGPYIWNCVYQVGRAQITLSITTEPGAPMPCKRKVVFE